jgi:Zn-dependent M28 family amino/carboxypeptidase
MSTTLRRRALSAAVVTTALVASTLALTTTTASGDPISETRAIRKAVTLAGVREHQAAFQDIADDNDGIRASGTPGYDASADYVAERLTAAGYTVTRQPFQFPFYEQLSPSTFQQVSPNPTSYVEGTDFFTMTYSGAGDVTAVVQAVDLVVPAAPVPNTSNSGCEASDFAGFTPGNIALMQRGTCPFGVKATNAQAAGAVAVIIFNEGQPGRTDPLGGTLGAPVAIPAVDTSYAIGSEFAQLAGAGGLTVRIKTDTLSEIRDTENVIAETSGDPHNVVLVGAHLDSVAAGPGINDNGSGSAAILEIAEQFKRLGLRPRNQVRFVWWGAEELNLLGSQFYVNDLTDDEAEDIALNLNFDMLGSPNFVRFVYDGDNSAFPVGPGAADGPEGSGEIERVFTDYFASQGLASSETPFSGRSDYGPFIAIGIPAGGLFSGAEGLKTAAEAAIYGGTVGAAYDPCYHQACDTYDNNSGTSLHQMSDAAAQATLLFAKRNFTRRPLVDPATPVSGTAGVSLGGGGLHDDHEEVAR